MGARVSVVRCIIEHMYELNRRGTLAISDVVRQDDAMVLSGDERTVQASSERDLFGRGWLQDQLDRVVRDLALRDDEDRPRLTGPRAASMSDPSWLRSCRS